MAKDNESKIIIETDEHTVGYFDMNTGDWLIHSQMGWMNNGDLYGESKVVPVSREARVGSAIVGVDVVAEDE